MNRLTKIVTGAAAGVGLLALMFSARGDSSETAEERADTDTRSATEDMVSSVIGPSERESPDVIRTELDGTDLFVG